MTWHEDVNAFLARFDIEPRDPALYEQVFTHRSYQNEHRRERAPSFERLEYLGDAVIELCVKRLLYERREDWPEGKMTEVSAAVLSGQFLGEIGLALGLGRLVRASKGEMNGGAALNVYVNACVLEALVGAVFLEQGFGAASLLVDFLMVRRIHELLDKTGGDLRTVKARFQEDAQARGLGTPEYRDVEQIGSDHAPTFTVELLVDGKVWATARARSKKDAQELAACKALETLDRRQS